MPNDDNKIILEFPATNVEIELGETITFDNISGFLNSDRVTYDGESLTDEITHLENDKADTTYVDNALNNKMDKANPTGTGSLSLNRKANTVVGNNSVAMGNNATASGENSMAIGNGSFANGANSVAMGNGTRALGSNQFVFGKHNNDSNYNNFVEIVGKGNAFTRSNARTLDWQGNETLAGDLTYNGNKSLTSEISRLDGRIDNLPAPMIFKGTLGVGGTIQTLPTASASNEGWTYKVITDGTYAGQTAKVGDVFTSSGSEWVYIPSGDEDNDTWRAIKINGVEKLGNGISSGAVDFVGSENIEVEFDANGNKVGVKTKNIYTKAEVDDIVSDAIYNVLPDDTASGSVANFTTSLELPIKSLEVDVNAVQNAGTPTPASPLPISGWSEITLVNCGNKYKPNIKPFSEWERARSDYYISRFSVPNTIITVNLIDKDTTVDLSGISFGYVDSNWDTTTPFTTTKYRWFIQGGIVQSGKRNISAGDANKILTGLIFYPTTEATYNKLMARYDYEFVFSETPNVEPYNTEVISLGGTYYGGHFTQDKAGHRQFEVTHKRYDLSALSWQVHQQGYYYATKPDDMFKYLSTETPEWIAERYQKATGQWIYGHGSTIGYIGANGGLIYCTDNTTPSGYLVAPLTEPIIIDLPDGEPIITLNGTNNIFADTGDCAVEYKCSVAEYVANHSGGGGAKSLGGVFLGGSEEEPTEESEETEKTKEIDNPKEEIKAIGDEPISKK